MLVIPWFSCNARNRYSKENEKRNKPCLHYDESQMIEKQMQDAKHNRQGQGGGYLGSIFFTCLLYNNYLNVERLQNAKINLNITRAKSGQTFIESILLKCPPNHIFCRTFVYLTPTFYPYHSGRTYGKARLHFYRSVNESTS